ncbi:MAG: HU family DNA-binding protein [Clostridia bacterium]|nr:HU family DNA-binding protein [Oscillospiraceae bacterium]MBR5453545.1 HU family DNA-binding protein [Clostridia bacterium]
MNKTQLVDAVAKSANLKKKDAEAAVNAFVAAISDSLKKGDKVQLVGFGTFDVKERAARQGRNPATGKAMTIPASKHIAFTVGKTLKDEINK